MNTAQRLIFGTTPDGVEFCFEQVDADWLAQNRPAIDKAQRDAWLKVKLHIDPNTTPYSSSVDSVLCAMSLNHNDYQWENTELLTGSAWLLQFKQHRLMRQDDNGHEFEVGVYASKSEATQTLKTLEQNIHKQHYWIERVDDQ